LALSTSPILGNPFTGAKPDSFQALLARDNDCGSPDRYLLVFDLQRNFDRWNLERYALDARVNRRRACNQEACEERQALALERRAFTGILLMRSKSDLS
jgi:hypothetical protein